MRYSSSTIPGVHGGESYFRQMPSWLDRNETSVAAVHRPRARDLDLASAIQSAAVDRHAAPGPHRHQVVIHVSPDPSKALRQLALDEDTTLQALGLSVPRRALRSPEKRAFSWWVPSVPCGPEIRTRKPVAEIFARLWEVWCLF